MSINLYDDGGHLVVLGQVVGKGGEGTVYEVAGRPDTVAKVYHDPAASTERAAKLRALPAISTPGLRSVTAWPTSSLSDRPGGAFRGILLPRVAGREIHFVYSPAQRRQLYPDSDWSFLVHVAMNVAGAVQTIHENGCLVADLNQGGFFVSDQGTVRLIECDSFQFRHNGHLYRCTVRVPHFAPPELNGVDLATTDATPAQDSFSLGVLLFHLLFLGRHPFAGRYTGSGDMPIEQAIRERRFAFSAARATFDMDVPPYSAPLQLVPPRLADLFERAFRGDPPDRPTAAEWYRELQSLRNAITTCGADTAHRYSSHLPDCPWCRLEHAGLPPLFGTAPVSYEFDAGFDIDAFWLEVGGLPEVPGVDPLMAVLTAPPTVPPSPRPLPERALYRALGPIQTVPPLPPALELVSPPEVPPFRPPSASDPGSGYEPEPLPTIDPFEPEVGPPDPPLALHPLPSPPAEHRRDYMAAPLERMKALRRLPEYRIAKWSAIVCAATAVLVFVHGHRPVAVVAAALGVGFGFVWVVIATRIRLACAAAVRLALAEQANAAERQQQRHAAYEAERGRVEEANARRRALHDRLLGELAGRRAGLPQLNAERRRQWEVQRQQVEALAAAARARNAERSRRWDVASRRIIAEQRHAWEIEVLKVEAARERAQAENQDRRRAWGDAMAAHAAQCREIDEANARRAAAIASFEAELKSREAEVRQAEAAAQAIVHAWASEQPSFASRLAVARGQLQDIRNQYMRLKGEFEAARDRLIANSERAQFGEFLRQHLIATASIPNVGEKRKQTLAAFGIETAFDVTDHQLAAVVGKGFGPVVFTSLRTWRIVCEQQFVFDPKRQIATPEMRSLQGRSTSECRAVKAALHSELTAARQVVAEAGARLRERSEGATAAMSRWHQARADLNVAMAYGCC